MFQLRWLCFIVITTIVMPTFTFSSCPLLCTCKWRQGRQQVNCSHAGLTSLPVKVDHSADILIMKNNPLRRLKKNAFYLAGLKNIKSLFLSNCQLEDIHSSAFYGLTVLGSIDLSYNNLTKIRTKTFDGLKHLFQLSLSHNPLFSLSSYQLPPLSRLKEIDLSHCGLNQISLRAFYNLGASVETIYLNNNKLRHLDLETFSPLINLSSLELHDNPWVCDCKLKYFRDWASMKRLFNEPTKCFEPERLHGDLWSDLTTSDFACKPSISLPTLMIFGASGVTTTISCRVIGNPIPKSRWVRKGLIINNGTSYVVNNRETKYLIETEMIGSDSIERWFNLTIQNPTRENLGNYTCVAENGGGVMEKTATLTFASDPNFSIFSGMNGHLSTEQITIIVGVTAATVVFFLLLCLICCYCFCQRFECLRHPWLWCSSEKFRSPAASTTAVGPHGSESCQKLLSAYNSVTSPCTDINSSAAAMLTSSSSFYGFQTVSPDDDFVELQNVVNVGGCSSTGSCLSEVGGCYYPPDLLLPDLQNEHPSSPTADSGIGSSSSTAPERKPTAEVLNAASLSSYPYAHSMNSGSFQRSGTLPHRQGSHRSISYDHGSSPRGLNGQQHFWPVINQLQNKSRVPLGYVTLPRRPRSSMSSRCDAASMPLHYDGVGPRTSADGSSRISLNKTVSPVSVVTTSSWSLARSRLPLCDSLPSASSIFVTSALATSSPRSMIPPIEEEIGSGSIPSSPIKSNGFPNNNSSLHNGSGGDESFGPYCEPFGTALCPSHDHIDEANELSTVVSSLNSSRTGSSCGLPKIPPKTLPKPRFSRDVNKSVCHDDTSSTIIYQDEGIDGSEV